MVLRKTTKVRFQTFKIAGDENIEEIGKDFSSESDLWSHISDISNDGDSKGSVASSDSQGLTQTQRDEKRANLKKLTNELDQDTQTMIMKDFANQTKQV